MYVRGSEGLIRRIMGSTFLGVTGFFICIAVRCCARGDSRRTI
jgi:hypothetical protein